METANGTMEGVKASEFSVDLGDEELLRVLSMCCEDVYGARSCAVVTSGAAHSCMCCAAVFRDWSSWLLGEEERFLKYDWDHRNYIADCHRGGKDWGA